MMYYRRRILLGLIEKFGGQIYSINLQKYLFLFTRMQQIRSFDFIPNKYGCYSIQANNDLSVLEKQGFLKKEKEGNDTLWKSTCKKLLLSEMKREDIAILNTIFTRFGKINSTELIKYTYLNYPYYASKSTIAKNILSDNEYEAILATRKVVNSYSLFTIGYEGISLETYLNKLIRNNIKILCDIRKNPLSKKYGFSKSQLNTACNSIGIEYIHIPELGIVADKRKNLQTLKDYQKLFNEYELTTLVENKKSLDKIISLLYRYKRIALTCFEAKTCMCHRSRVTKALVSRPDWNIPVIDL